MNPGSFCMHAWMVTSDKTYRLYKVTQKLQSGTGTPCRWLRYACNVAHLHFERDGLMLCLHGVSQESTELSQCGTLKSVLFLIII